MAEFKNNKEGKIEELKVRGPIQLFFVHKWLMTISLQASISKQKASLQKHAVTVKVQQKEHHTATLELGE